MVSPDGSGDIVEASWVSGMCRMFMRNFERRPNPKSPEYWKYDPTYDIFSRRRRL